jgi:hypothetical protein
MSRTVRALAAVTARAEANEARNTAPLADTEVTNVKSSVASVSESVQAQDTWIDGLEVPTKGLLL